MHQVNWIILRKIIKKVLLINKSNKFQKNWKIYSKKDYLKIKVTEEATINIIQVSTSSTLCDDAN